MRKYYFKKRQMRPIFYISMKEATTNRDKQHINLTWTVQKKWEAWGEITEMYITCHFTNKTQVPGTTAILKATGNGETSTSWRKDFFKSLWAHILWHVGSHAGKHNYSLVVAIQNITDKYPSIKRVRLMKNSWRGRGKSCFLASCCFVFCHTALLVGF